MIRLHLIVEGQTEETFARDILAPSLGFCNVFADVRCTMTGRKHGRIFRGGLVSYEKVRHDIELWMRQDRKSDSRFTTMFDLYRLPNDFPGYGEGLGKTDVYDRIALLEKEFANDVGRDYFIPYIQVHEFEALLFAAPEKFLSAFPGREKQTESLIRIRDEFRTPEHINNDDPPSKKILRIIPDYDKVEDGTMIVREIGLNAVRQACLHFDEWMGKLEVLDD